MPFSFSPVVWFVVASSVLLGGLWLIDEIGDRREAKVHARYAKAADATNLDIRAFNSEDDRVAAVSQAMLVKALDKAKAVPGKLIVSKEQAAALSEIKWP